MPHILPTRGDHKIAEPGVGYDRGHLWIDLLNPDQRRSDERGESDRREAANPGERSARSSHPAAYEAEVIFST